MKRFRPYWTAFRIRALLETRYRAAAFGGVATQAFFGLLLILLYTALYDGKDAEGLQDTVTYVWLQQMFFRAFLSNDNELSQRIMDGGMAYTLIEPVDQHIWWSFRALAQKTCGVMMRLIPMLLLQCILPVNLRMSGPESLLGFCQFLLSTLLGFLCVTQISMICMAITMITLDSRGITGMINLIMMIFCGNIIPLTMFPESMQHIIRYQPFAQAIDASIRMYQHTQSAHDFVLHIGVQLLWIALLTILARYLWHRELNRIVIQGG